MDPATVGIMISTGIVGTGFWLASNALGISVPLAWALVFGALISPTDPVAVLSTLKTVKVPEMLKTDMTGESLFNDGIAAFLAGRAVEIILCRYITRTPFRRS